MSFLLEDTTSNKFGLEMDKKSHVLFAKGNILAIQMTAASHAAVWEQNDSLIAHLTAC